MLFRSQADAKLGDQESDARSKLPQCPGPIGGTSEIALRNLARSYYPKHIGLAEQYLAKIGPMAQQLRAVLAPEVANADAAVSAWSQIQNPALKQQLAGSASGIANTGYGDVTYLIAFVSDTSKRAAQAVADKNATERRYAAAKGC